MRTEKLASRSTAGRLESNKNASMNSAMVNNGLAGMSNGCVYEITPAIITMKAQNNEVRS